MASITIAGIMRSGAYSPNHIGNDAAIFNAVTEQLRKRGCVVKVYSEEQLIAGEVTEEVVMNMCRQQRSLEVLQRMEDAGAVVINSGYGIENCTHSRMTRILVGSDIPYPESILTDTNAMVLGELTERGFGRCWVKRGEAHTEHKEDVCCVRSANEAQEVLKEYFLRGITRAVVSKHVVGEHIKFYGVLDTPFFYTFPAASDGPVPIDAATTARLHDICCRAASELGIKVYGGDCIVADDGSITIIDFNDWPSFAPCRREAATAIAKCIIGAVKERRKPSRAKA